MFDLEESEFLTFWNVTCSIGIILVLTVILINTSRRKDVSENVPDNVVLLYQVGRGPCAPSSSPFPLKLETFLRMYKIPYVNDHSGQFSSKGKTPWIKYNGVAVADSEFCIEFLKRERNIDKEKISPFLKATGRALQKLTEENLYWTMCYSMFVENQDMIATVMPQYRGWRLKLLVIILSRVLRLEMWGHGIGRHSSNDIWHIGKEDIGALSNYLGERMFFLGDKPHEVDCALFGMLAQIIYHMPGSPHEKLIKEKHYNLSSYCDRMKDLYWPDWNERCYNVLTPKDDMGKIYFSY